MALSEPENIPCGVLIAIESESTRTAKYPLGERKMQHHLSTLRARFRCALGVDQFHHTASRGDRPVAPTHEVRDQQPPTGIQDAFGQMPVVHHSGNPQVFQGDALIGGEQTMTELVQEIFPPVRDAFMHPLECCHRFVAIRAPFVPSRYTPLGHSEMALAVPIPDRMSDMFPVARGEERGQPDIDTDLCTHWLKPCKAPNLCLSRGEACGGLKPIAVSESINCEQREGVHDGECRYYGPARARDVVARDPR
jgi:hypothetical protein